MLFSPGKQRKGENGKLRKGHHGAAGVTGRVQGLTKGVALTVLFCKPESFTEDCVECGLEMSSQDTHNTCSYHRGSVGKLLGACIIRNQFLRATSSRSALTPWQSRCGGPQKWLLLGAPPVSFSAALYDTSSKLALGFLLKRGVLWGFCCSSFRRREGKEQCFKGKKTQQAC